VRQDTRTPITPLWTRGSLWPLSSIGGPNRLPKAWRTPWASCVNERGASWSSATVICDAGDRFRRRGWLARICGNHSIWILHRQRCVDACRGCSATDLFFPMERVRNVIRRFAGLAAIGAPVVYPHVPAAIHSVGTNNIVSADRAALARIGLAVGIPDLGATKSQRDARHTLPLDSVNRRIPKRDPLIAPLPTPCLEIRSISRHQEWANSVTYSASESRAEPTEFDPQAVEWARDVSSGQPPRAWLGQWVRRASLRRVTS
jgi:hypothetical protein